MQGLANICVWHN